MIWWQCMKAKNVMIRDEFIKHHNITYLHHKHKKWNWSLHKNPIIYVQS